MWEYLPELILEEVFSMLSYRDRARCARVCQQWYSVFLSPRIWRHLRLTPELFTYDRHHPIQGYIKELSHRKVQLCLGTIGNFLQKITIAPNANYHNLYEFMNVLTTYLWWHEEYPLPLLESFAFTFCCEITGLNGSITLGTGGQILAKLKSLIENLQNLKELRLNNLLLESKDVIGLLDKTRAKSGLELTHLELLNLTKERYPLFAVAHFPHLQTLTITSPSLNKDIVILLAKHKLFRELILVQNNYTSNIEPLPTMTWLDVKQTNPEFKVRLEVRGKTNINVFIHERAPVHAIIYESPYCQVDTESILQISDQYSRTLTTFGHTMLPRFHRARSFYDRADTGLVLLIQECPNIETLVVRERVSTTTLLIIASEAKKLKKFYVRKNAVIKRFEWPQASRWSDDFYKWLKVCSGSFPVVEREISKLLHTHWIMLTDKEFKNVSV